MRSENSEKTTIQGNKVSRRRFVAQTAAMSVLAVAGAPMASTAMADMPKRGGTLRLGLGDGDSTMNLNPETAVAKADVYLNSCVYNNLVEVLPDNTLAPELAAAWEAKDGGKEWIIDLRRDVSFSNGKALSAEDAVYSINLHRREDSRSGAKGLLKIITEVKKVDSHQVLISLESPDAELPYVLSDYHLWVVPDGFSDWKSPIGTGGYLLKEFQPGVRSTLERRPDYWKEGRAHVDDIEMIHVTDMTARVNALISGQVDAIDQVDTRVAERLANSPGISLVRSQGKAHYTIPMLSDMAPTDDHNVRMALKHAINREQMIENILLGYGAIGNDHPIPSTDPFFNSELPQRPYDPDKSKFYLNKAGLSSLEVELSSSNAALNRSVDIATLFKESARPGSINLDVKQYPGDGFWSDVWQKKALLVDYWFGRPTPGMMFATAYQSGVPWNESHWSNAEFDKLLVEARATIDDDRRRELYWECQRILHEEGAVIVPMFAETLDAASDKVGGIEPHGFAGFNGNRVGETAWMV